MGSSVINLENLLISCRDQIVFVLRQLFEGDAHYKIFEKMRRLIEGGAN